VDGSAVVVSQFTLLADYHHGNRPSFLEAASPDLAEPLYEHFVHLFSDKLGKQVGKGVFGADMLYEIANDGPVTIVMDSDVLKKNKR
jgi:D-tyrosyl-tRNA(Tyr) deacylase